MKEIYNRISNHNEAKGTYYSPVLCDNGSIDIINTRTFKVQKSFVNISDALENLPSKFEPRKAKI